MTPPQTTGTPVLLPSLGEHDTEATITRWLKNPGDSIEVDEPLLEVATDKVDTEIPSPIAGTILELVVAEGEPATVDATIAIIDVEGESPAGPQTMAGTLEPAPATAPTDTELPPCPAIPNPEPAVPAVHTATRSATPQTREQHLPKIRQIIARRMLESLHTSAQLTTVVEADITGIARLRAAEKDEFARRTRTNLSYLPFFAKATVEALVVCHAIS